jgi:hypothetical protein
MGRSRKRAAPADEVSFDAFVTSYLEKVSPEAWNEHFWPQAWHLAPVGYTEIWPMSQMQSHATNLFGAGLAKKYFKVKHNATSDYKTYSMPDASVRTAMELFEQFKRTGAIPDKKSFLCSKMREGISRIYWEDHSLRREEFQFLELERA